MSDKSRRVILGNALVEMAVGVNQYILYRTDDILNCMQRTAA